VHLDQLDGRYAASSQRLKHRASGGEGVNGVSHEDALSLNKRPCFAEEF
jgi:hypothetical protein